MSTETTSTKIEAIVGHPGVRYHPAECWSGCTDEWCPYSHRQSWECVSTGVHYDSREAAVAAAKPTPRRRQITGRSALRVDDVTRPE